MRGCRSPRPRRCPTVSDLREQLARRIFDIIWKGNPPPVDLEPIADLKGTSYGKLADECIRQMEFARRCVGVTGPTTIESTKLSFGEIVPTTIVVSAAKPHLPPLGAAPDDWKVPE